MKLFLILLLVIICMLQHSYLYAVEIAPYPINQRAYYYHLHIIDKTIDLTEYTFKNSLDFLPKISRTQHSDMLEHIDDIRRSIAQASTCL